MMKGNGPLVLGVTLVAIILAAVTWFFFVQPREDARVEAADAAIAQRDFNDTLRLRIQELEEKSLLLPEWREEIYEVRRDFPSVADIPAVRDEIHEIFVERDLVIFSDSFGAPVPVTPLTSYAAAAEATGVTSQIDGLAFDGLLAVPVTIQTAGSYADTMALLDDLQYGDHIYFLVSSVQTTPFTSDEVTTGGVQVRPGDLATSLTFHFFVLDYGNPEISLPPVEPELDEDGNPIVEPAEPEPEVDEDGNPIEPDPNDSRNPFNPVAGTGDPAA